MTYIARKGRGPTTFTAASAEDLELIGSYRAAGWEVCTAGPIKRQLTEDPETGDTFVSYLQTYVIEDELCGLVVAESFEGV